MDLGSDVADPLVGEVPLEAAEHRPDDRHERRPVVGHQLVRHTDLLDRLFEQDEDLDRLLGRHRPDPEQEPDGVLH